MGVTFDLWAVSGLEADMERAVVEALNTQSLDTLILRADLPGGDPRAAQQEMETWTWKGEKAQWGAQQWRWMEHQLEEQLDGGDSE